MEAVQKVKRSGETFQHLCKESPSITYQLATVQNIAQAQMKCFALKNHSAAKRCVCVLPGSEMDQHTEQPLMQEGGGGHPLHCGPFSSTVLSKQCRILFTRNASREKRPEERPNAKPCTLVPSRNKGGKSALAAAV